MNEYAGFDSDCKWFRENRDKIIAGHHKDLVVIRDHEVKGYYPNVKAALEGAKPLVIGECVISQCLTEKEEREMVLGRRFIFA